MNDIQFSGDLLKEHVYQNFKQLFDRKNKFRIHLKEGAWESKVELFDLDEEIQEEEIKRVVWKLGEDKALGPDRIPLFFFKFFSEDIKMDFAWLMKDLLKGISRLDRINYSVITLIPKKCSHEKLVIIDRLLC